MAVFDETQPLDRALQLYIREYALMPLDGNGAASGTALTGGTWDWESRYGDQWFWSSPLQEVTTPPPHPDEPETNTLSVNSSPYEVPVPAGYDYSRVGWVWSATQARYSLTAPAIPEPDNITNLHLAYDGQWTQKLHTTRVDLFVPGQPSSYAAPVAYAYNPSTQVGDWYGFLPDFGYIGGQSYDLREIERAAWDPDNVPSGTVSSPTFLLRLSVDRQPDSSWPDVADQVRVGTLSRAWQRHQVGAYLSLAVTPSSGPVPLQVALSGAVGSV